MLSQREGDVGGVVEEMGHTLHAPHIDGDRIRAYFRRRHKAESAEVLERIALEGSPTDAWAGGNLKSAQDYGNHRSATKYGGDVLRKAATDMALGRTIVFLVMQITSVTAIKERRKLRLIRGFTFGVLVTVKEARGTLQQKAYMKPGGRSMNTGTDWRKIPECRLAGGMTAIITRVLGLQAIVGIRKWILLQKMNINSAFRQVVVALDREVAFAYWLEDHILIDH